MHNLHTQKFRSNTTVSCQYRQKKAKQASLKQTNNATQLFTFSR